MFMPAFFLAASLLVTQPSPPRTAIGMFDVAVTPNPTVSGQVGLLALGKTYHGDFEGSGAGQMLGAGDPGAGTASYVALEQVTGTLAGRHGAFMLQHSGSMHDGRQVMNVRIAPGSGTGELLGISGTMEIVIEGGVHRYTLRYQLGSSERSDAPTR